MGVKDFFDPKGGVVLNIDKAINYMRTLKARGVRYSMNGSRTGADGTADCSGSIYSALRQAGLPKASHVLSTETMHDWLLANGFKLYAYNKSWQAQKGDVVIFGKKGYSIGSGGHVVLFTEPYKVIHTYPYNGYNTTGVFEEPDKNIYNMYGKYGHWYVYRYQGATSNSNTTVTDSKAPLPIKQEFLPRTKTFKNHVSKKIGITIHQPGAPQRGANARAMANYQRSMSNPNNREEKSWHYQLDDKEAIQSFPHEVGCWHASDGSGDGNKNTIAIEACINADGDYVKTIHNLAKLCAWICYQEGFDPYKQIFTHYYWSKKAGRAKWCPQQILNGVKGYTLAKVIDMTADELAKLKGKKRLESSDTKPYQAPKLPFKELKVGDTVTLADNFLWYDPQTGKQLLSNKQKELIGTKDKIKQVKDIEDCNFSKVAYLLEKYNSWILEEDLVEVKADWVDTGKTDDSEPKLKDGQFLWQGKIYEIKEVR